jgi:hypothetical protein
MVKKQQQSPKFRSSRTLSRFICACLLPFSSFIFPTAANASAIPTVDETVNCEILVIGGGLAGIAATYEGLLAGRTVCLTEITDWIGGQLSSQGTAALDEAKKQRTEMFYSRGYKELRDRIQAYYEKSNPGQCWVSLVCFLPKDGNKILWEMLEEAREKGGGKLHWFPITVAKKLEMSGDGKKIDAVIAIQNIPKNDSQPQNTATLSQNIEDIYSYRDSERFDKKIIRFSAPEISTNVDRKGGASWYVVEATETGEIVALADVPYRLGIDPLSYRNPSSPSQTGDPYCTQGFTYTFAMERTAENQSQQMPSFYPQYENYYSYDQKKEKANFDFIFTYRRILSPNNPTNNLYKGFVGDISMQNWVWGNDYRPGTSQDNLIYTRDRLQQMGQIANGNNQGDWMGGLRVESLRKGEEIALGFYYWIVGGTTDSQLGDDFKKPIPNHILLTGLDSPMGTLHGLSKYPYIRESRRIIGRESFGYREGFSIDELDISGKDFKEEYYKNLPPEMYWDVQSDLSGNNLPQVIAERPNPDEIENRTRSTIYPDAVGIAQYAIDFHPCMTDSPPEAKGNTERAGVRQAHGFSYPAQIPLRATIPQKIDNLLVTGKSLAFSYIAAAAYRVHSFEWSSGAAVGVTIDFALDEGIYPYKLVDDLPRSELQLRQLRRLLEERGNPTAFPNTSIFNSNWSDWKIW